MFDIYIFICTYIYLSIYNRYLISASSCWCLCEDVPMQMFAWEHFSAMTGDTSSLSTELSQTDCSTVVTKYT